MHSPSAIPLGLHAIQILAYRMAPIARSDVEDSGLKKGFGSLQTKLTRLEPQRAPGLLFKSRVRRKPFDAEVAGKFVVVDRDAKYPECGFYIGAGVGGWGRRRRSVLFLLVLPATPSEVVAAL
jgi:hypothetical protein